MTEEILREKIAAAVCEVKRTNPLAPSVTNTVTMNFVANAQLAVGGSAAMVFLPDEGEMLAKTCGAVYLNVGTLLPVLKETHVKTAKAAHEAGKVCVLDPVGIGIGSMRTEILTALKESKPKIIRGNASEIISLHRLWLEKSFSSTARGVDTTESVEEAELAANELALYTGGAVSVSGKVDYVTDGTHALTLAGGSELMTRITGSGCSLGGAMAVYACVSEPFVAAVTGAIVFKLAGNRASQKADAPASFQTSFLDELYKATSGDIAAYPFELCTL